VNIYLIFHYIGYILGINTLFMVPALGISFFNGEWRAVFGFFITMVLMLTVSMPLITKKPKSRAMFEREGFIVVSLAWLILSLFSALPFYVSGAIPSYVDCFFETVSGFTTTGASILSDIEALPMGILYWRSFTHWVGGMGVLVFILAIMPTQHGSGDNMHILRAESPGPSVGKLVPKLRHTAQILYSIYIILTVLEMVLLLFGGMPLFDSIVNSFATAGTGGFAIKNAGIGAYNSYYLQGVIAVFMVLFGVNFTVYHLMLLGEFSQALKSEELHAYLGIILASTLLIAINIFPQSSSWFDALHHSFFQVSSIITTTGFATADFNLWPSFSKFVLLLLMILGACAGSTGGGIKISRVLILLKSIRGEFRRLLHPNSIKVVKIDGKPLDHATKSGVQAFMVVYSLLTIFSILLLSLDGFDVETTLSAVLACINNIGPGFGAVGPMSNFSEFSDWAKILLSMDMLIGRLEIYPMLLLFSPSVWRKPVRRLLNR